jgi:ketosteroid isomerase-like protein
MTGGAISDEQRIRELIERWAAAVHDGDLPAVVADRSADVVMFDVPPPEEGIRGIDAYRETWPGFFAWQAAGAVFEIESLEIAAGDEVAFAFAFALLRCGTPADFDRDPDYRLRLTIGLRKVEGRWIVTHEHHSFTHAAQSSHAAEAEVRAIHQQWFERTAAKDLDGLMEHVASDIVSYEHAGALQYTGIDDVRQVCEGGLNASPDQIDFDIPDLTVRAHGNLAIAWGIDHIAAAADTEIRSRATRVFERRGGRWEMIHQHLSIPVTDVD